MSESNFLEFIKEDVNNKRTLISGMPIKTKSNREALVKKLDSFKEKYESYREAVKKYIDIKSNSFKVSETENNNEILEKIKRLEDIKQMLNPNNTYFEKMGFSTLLFEINNCNELKFEGLNKIIDGFLDKFSQVGINLNGSDFDYTCFVNHYMTSYLNAKAGYNSFSETSEVFEQIYWLNPEIIGHIELSFRKLIGKHEKRFIEFVEKSKADIMANDGVSSYERLLEKLKAAYLALEENDTESINDIIEKAQTGQIDITHYFDDNKIRMATYDDLMIDHIDEYNKEEMNKFYRKLEKLKNNLNEFKNYLDFKLLIDDFKKNYEKLLGVENNSAKELKALEDEIDEKEKVLDKLNKDIFPMKEKTSPFGKLKDINKLKTESIRQAKELYSLYKEYDKKYFLSKVLSAIHSSFSVTEFLELYSSYDYFKKEAIARIYNLTKYEEIEELSADFDKFANNMANVIVNGILVFEEANIAKTIVNRYRFDGIKVDEIDLNQETIETFINKLKLPLRIKTIEESDLSLDKIWFIIRVEKINKTSAI